MFEESLFPYVQTLKKSKGAHVNNFQKEKKREGEIERKRQIVRQRERERKKEFQEIFSCTGD